MMASLQVECPKLPESDAPTNPSKGELYTAYYDKDDSWYRWALIIKQYVMTYL